MPSVKHPGARVFDRPSHGWSGSEVIGIYVLDEGPELVEQFARRVGFFDGRLARLVEHSVGHEHRAADPGRERQRIAWPRRDDQRAGSGANVQFSEERSISQFGDDHPFEPATEFLDHRTQQVMREGTRRHDFAQCQRNGFRLERADEDGQDPPLIGHLTQQNGRRTCGHIWSHPEQFDLDHDGELNAPDSQVPDLAEKAGDQNGMHPFAELVQ